MKYTEKEKQKVKQLYLEGNSSLTIQRITGIGKTTIENWAKKEGYSRNKKSLKNKIKDNVITEYVEGSFLSEIASKYNISETTIINWLKEENIDRRHKGPKSKINNESYFDNIDTEKKAYYLGWIMADGNVSIINGQYSLKLHISYNDKQLIDNFLKEIDSTNKTRYNPNNGNGSYYVSLTSVHMIKKLFEYGIVPNKSGKECIPNIPKELIPHFIRGFYDGDGLAGTYQTGFIGTKEILNQILEHLNLTSKLYRAKCEIEMYYFCFAKKKSKVLYDYLYRDATIFLDRKKKAIENIIYGNTEIINESKESLIL